MAANLGIDLRVIPIGPMHEAFEKNLSPHFEGRPPDTTEENVQARIRGNILMSLSNKFGWLLLTTGNKSELAVGYCTLYGDMCGGLAVISDVPKTTVYELARWFNARAAGCGAGSGPVIPESSITKLPSAELRPDQHDQQTLPPYDVLDAILHRYIEQEKSADEIIAEGFDAAVVRDVIHKVDVNEYKRKQAATGLKVTSRAFGVGRRMPIAART
jgi:NAD+ synthetase